MGCVCVGGVCGGVCVCVFALFCFVLFVVVLCVLFVLFFEMSNFAMATIGFYLRNLTIDVLLKEKTNNIQLLRLK